MFHFQIVLQLFISVQIISTVTLVRSSSYDNAVRFDNKSVSHSNIHSTERKL
jgi:hypothetical protein